MEAKQNWVNSILSNSQSKINFKICQKKTLTAVLLNSSSQHQDKKRHFAIAKDQNVQNYIANVFLINYFAIQSAVANVAQTRKLIRNVCWFQENKWVQKRLRNKKDADARNLIAERNIVNVLAEISNAGSIVVAVTVATDVLKQPKNKNNTMIKKSLKMIDIEQSIYLYELFDFALNQRYIIVKFWSAFLKQEFHYHLTQKIMEIRQTQHHNLNAISVKEYAYYEDKNYPTRQTMEDNYIIQDKFDKNGSGLFAILDGHGGNEVSEYCANTIPNLFQVQYSKEKNNIKSAFQKVCVKADEQLKLVGASQTGSTCCMVFIKKNGQKRTCHVANLGDTRAVLCIDNSTARRVSVDHKVSNPSEQQRVKKQGGLILKNRVAGQLAITRALGDLQLKSQGVSNIPDYQEFQITNKTSFLIVASDGLWDVCQDQQAIDLVKNGKHSLEMAKTLVQYSLKNGSKDNISVLILKF